MNTTGYIINSVLVLLVVRQIRERPPRLDRRSLVLPLVLVAVAAANFLHTIPTAGERPRSSSWDLPRSAPRWACSAA